MLSIVSKRYGWTKNGELNRQIRFLSPENSFFTFKITEKSNPIAHKLRLPFQDFQLDGETVKVKNGTELLSGSKFSRSQIVEIWFKHIWYPRQPKINTGNVENLYEGKSGFCSIRQGQVTFSFHKIQDEHNNRKVSY